MCTRMIPVRPLVHNSVDGGSKNLVEDGVDGDFTKGSVSSTEFYLPPTNPQIFKFKNPRIHKSTNFTNPKILNHKLHKSTNPKILNHKFHKP